MANLSSRPEATHSVAVGYILAIFGFTGVHRFYFGKQLSGLLYLCTGGLFLIGWIYDLIFMSSLAEDASESYRTGPYDYTVAWLLLGFLGVFGAHRFYQGKLLTAVLYLLTAGGFGLGVIYDLFTLNGQLDELNG